AAPGGDKPVRERERRRVGLAHGIRIAYRARVMPPRRPLRSPRKANPSAPPVKALSLRHPAWILASLVAAGCVVLSVSAWIYDTDFWHHLLVGKVIWQTHAIPTLNLWTWPAYGKPDANNAWLFRALVWPLWSAGGVTGLFVWRWLSTLAVFGVAWAAARRMGARGFTPLIVLVACSLVYRQRTQLRPETLVSVLMALQIWLLESRRTALDAALAAARAGAPMAPAPAL